MPRTVRIAAISFGLGQEPMSAQEKHQQAFGYLEGALRDSPDLILLPELYEIMGTHEWAAIGQIDDPEDRKRAVMDFAAPEDGELFDRFRTFAAKSRTIIVGNHLVRAGDRAYNQATFFGRRGELLGRYRKVQPTEGEYERFGIQPGDKIEPIEVEGVRYGVFICNDQAFPEICQLYALQGTDVLLHPTQAAGPNETIRSEMLHTRAHDSSCFLAISSYIKGEKLSWQTHQSRATIVDFNGYPLADLGFRDGHACATLDLDEERWTSWCTNHDHRKTILRQHRTGLFARLYGELQDQNESMIPEPPAGS